MKVTAALGCLAAGVLAASAAQAQASKERPAELERLMACRGMSDSAARLACFDAAAAALDTAESKGEVVVVNREQANRVKRQAFGLTLPSLSLFDRDDEAPMEALTATVKAASRNGDGRWVVTLEDGAVWMQTDQEPVPRQPRPGSQAEIRRAAMGSFFMKLDGQRAVRARRVE
jgi:hypothetical protein